MARFTAYVLLTDPNETAAFADGRPAVGAGVGQREISAVNSFMHGSEVALELVDEFVQLRWIDRGNVGLVDESARRRQPLAYRTAVG